MQFNAAGLHLVQLYEKLELEPYRDSGGKWTVGWGHLIKPGEEHLMAGVTREQANTLLIEDLRAAQAAVREGLTRPVNPNMFSALVAFTYNVGRGQETPKRLGWLGSTLRRHVNAGDFAAAAGEFEKWTKVRQNGKLVKAEGLVRRRACEQFLFTAPMVQLTRADVEEACAGEEQA